MPANPKVQSIFMICLRIDENFLFFLLKIEYVSIQNFLDIFVYGYIVNSFSDKLVPLYKIYPLKFLIILQLIAYRNVKQTFFKQKRKNKNICEIVHLITNNKLRENIFIYSFV